MQTDFDITIKGWFENRGLDLDTEFIDKVGLYNDLILEWSQKMNLVSKKDLGNLLERHILDSLTPIDEIPRSGALVDIGSGAGFPAIPIALIRPNLDILMIESIGKKVVFLNEAISRLSLQHIAIWHGRLEEFSPVTKFDIVTVRAVKITEKLKQHLIRITLDSGKIIYYNRFNEYRRL